MRPPSVLHPRTLACLSGTNPGLEGRVLSAEEGTGKAGKVPVGGSVLPATGARSSHEELEAAVLGREQAWSRRTGDGSSPLSLSEVKL